MQLSELINKYQEFLLENGDGNVKFDIPERSYYTEGEDMELCGKYYQGNYWFNGKPDNNIFIIINERS